jgi:hypothetical protein
VETAVEKDECADEGCFGGEFDAQRSVRNMQSFLTPWVCVRSFSAGRIIQDLVSRILIDVGALYKASEAVIDACLQT